MNGGGIIGERKRDEREEDKKSENEKVHLHFCKPVSTRVKQKEVYATFFK